MTVASTESRSRFSGNGITTTFPLPFRVLAAEHLLVTSVSSAGNVRLVLGTHYTVAAVAAAGNASVVLTAPLPSGTELVVLRRVPTTQLTDIANQGPFLPRVHEDVFDQLAMANQQQDLALTRSLVLRETDEDGSGAYDAKGNRITGLAAPVGLSDAVTVQYAGALLGAMPSSGTATSALVLADGSSLPRSLGARAALPRHVRDYGAIGDGVADDTAAFRAAIAAGGRVVFDRGAYRITGTLTLAATTELVGTGWDAELRVDLTAPRFIPIVVQSPTLASLPGVVLSNFQLNGQQRGLLDAGLVQLNNAVGFVADHLWLRNAGVPGESASAGVNGIAVSAGALGAVGSQGTIRDCLIEATTKAGINWTTEAINGTIVGNIVRGCTGNGTTPGIQVNGGYNVRIFGNAVYGNQGCGIYLATSGGPGSYRHARYGIIANNHCYQNGQGTIEGAGIFVANGAASASQFGRVVITGNVCHTNGVNVAADGIHLQNETSLLVVGNVCHNNRRAGVQVEACSNVTVRDNACESNNLANLANVSGIYVKTGSGAPTSRVTVSGNQCTNAGTQQFAVYYDDAAGVGASRLVITDNEAAGHSVSDGIVFDFPIPPQSYVRHRRAGLTTTDATPVSVGYATLAPNSAARASLDVVAMQTDGGNRNMWRRSALFTRGGGTAALEGAVQTAHAVESAVAWDATLDASGTALRGVVTGAAGTSVRWSSVLEIDAP